MPSYIYILNNHSTLDLSNPILINRCHSPRHSASSVLIDFLRNIPAWLSPIKISSSLRARCLPAQRQFNFFLRVPATFSTYNCMRRRQTRIIRRRRRQWRCLPGGGAVPSINLPFRLPALGPHLKWMASSFLCICVSAKNKHGHAQTCDVICVTPLRRHSGRPS